MLIHVSRDGQQFGPYTPEDAQAYLNNGSLLPTDLGWVEGAANWVPLPDLVAQAMSAPPTAMPGIACPQCGAGLEADQVVCLACGHNLDDPVEEPGQEGEGAAVVEEKTTIPMSVSYEDETAKRSEFVNSVGWMLLMSILLPVFNTAGQWSFPTYDMWVTPKAEETFDVPDATVDPNSTQAQQQATPAPAAKVDDPYTWPMKFDVLAAAVMGIVCCVLASAMHGRDRGIVLAVAVLGILGTIASVPEAGQFITKSKIDTSPPTPAEAPPQNGDSLEIDTPELSNQGEFGNLLWEKLGFDPSENMVFVALFLLAWVAIIGGAQSRFYRLDGMIPYVLSMIGGVCIILVWLLPGADGVPLLAVVDAVSADPVKGAGLGLMMAMQLGAGICCFLNQRGIRPSKMKKYAGLAVAMMVSSLGVGLVPTWGKVIYEESNSYVKVAQTREKYVLSQFENPDALTKYEIPIFDRAMEDLEKPLNARISSIFGWFCLGVKYGAWIIGLMMLLPLAVVELICGKREPDGQLFG